MYVRVKIMERSVIDSTTGELIATIGNAWHSCHRFQALLSNGQYFGEEPTIYYGFIDVNGIFHETVNNAVNSDYFMMIS